MSDNEYDVHLWLRIERGGENRRLPGVVRPLLCAVVPLRRVLAPRPRFGRRRSYSTSTPMSGSTPPSCGSPSRYAPICSAPCATGAQPPARRPFFLHSVRRVRRGFRQPRVVADRDRRDHAARGRGRLAAARPLPRHLPQKPQRAALERRNSRRNAYFRQDRRSADEQGAASPAQPAPQGVTRRGRNE